MTIHREDGKPYHNSEYEWKSASITVAGTGGDVDITAQSGFTTLFSTVKMAHYIKVESTATAYIRLNSASSDVITIGATSPFSSEFLKTKKLYCTTGGAAVTVTVTLT